jgi:hypothetical protein
MASDLRHRATAADSSRSTQLTRTASVSSTPPAYDTTCEPAASTPTNGYNPLAFFT